MDIEQEIKNGVDVLKKGGLVAFPTDTVYGLGASAYLPQAVERVFEVKERSLNMALPLLLADSEQIKEVAVNIPDVAWDFIREFMPGALTIVLLKSSLVPDVVTAGGRTVGVRIPAHPLPISLIRGLGAPLVGTSANRSGQPSPLTASEVAAQLGKKLGLIIDGGRAPGGKESTVVDVTGKRPLVLRQGAIPLEELKKVSPEIGVREAR